MNQKHIFTGAATAIITPMNASGVDYESFGRMIDFQLASGIKALIVCATTGEAPTLSDEEHCEAVAFAVKRVNGAIPIIAGTGSNDTAHAIMMTKRAADDGASAVLCVTPYYNKPTQTGLIRSFSAIADASAVPVILYNVPSRTGTNIEPSTYGVLADHPNICAIKEANGNLSKIMDTFRIVGDRLDIYSGNDDQIVPILAMGGKGVISVLSNVVPKQTVEMCDRFFRGDLQGSMKMQLDYLPLIHLLFSQTNPIPAKAAMAAMGYCEDYMRLPLTPMEEPMRGKLLEEMRRLNLI